MPSFTMRMAVLQFLAIHAVNQVVDRHFSKDTFRAVLENPAVQNFTAAFTDYDNIAQANATYLSNNTAWTAINRTAINSTSVISSNSTISNITAYSRVRSWSIAKHVCQWRSRDCFFYLDILLPKMLATAVVAVLIYWWQIGLERALPTRSRPGKIIEDTKAIAAEVEDEGREEEIVKRWIARGKVQRASISWFRTFLKWLLDITVGSFWQNVVVELLTDLLLGKKLESISDYLLGGLVTGPIGGIFSLHPLATLVAMVVIPAYRRMVFVAGMNLVFSIFWYGAIGILLSWAISTKFAQEMLRGMTEMQLEQNNYLRLSNDRQKEL